MSQLHATGAIPPALAAQPRAVHALGRLLAHGHAHAILLSGMPGSGPLQAAAWIAESTLCPQGGGDGCSTCQRVRRRVHPDLLWVRPEGASIGIDQVRSIVERVSMRPFEAAAQTIVLEDADSLASDNADAGNALLKALEEPAGPTVFVLLARRPARLLPTIRSRVIEVPFPAISPARLAEALRAEGHDDASSLAACGLDLSGAGRAARGDLLRAAELVTGGAAAVRRASMLGAAAQLATGRVHPGEVAGRILASASTADEIAAGAATAEFEALLERMSKDEARSFKAKSNKQGMDERIKRRARRARVAELAACLAELAGFWRDLLAVAAGAPEAIDGADRLADLERAAAGPAGQRAVAALDAIDEADARLRLNNADEQVTIAALCAELAALAEGRMRARRTMGAPARTATGYDLSFG